MRSAIAFMSCILLMPFVYSFLSMKLGVEVNLALVYLGSLIAGIAVCFAIAADD